MPDGLVRALERIDDCNKPERFAAWLMQIVRNRARNAREHRRVRSGPSLEEVDHPMTGHAGEAAARTVGVCRARCSPRRA